MIKHGKYGLPWLKAKARKCVLYGMAAGHPFILARRMINRCRGRTVVFYPDQPDWLYVIYKACLFLGYRMTNNPKERACAVMAWQDVTVRKREAAVPVDDSGTHVINALCNDISKQRLAAVFSEVFGYELEVDPTRYQGACVMKSDANARHDGQVVECPVERREPARVYQRLVNNVVDGGEYIRDIRVPVFRDVIPFVYLKYRRIGTRFSNENAYVKVGRVRDWISREEEGKILEVCRVMGMEYGELDVARDRDTQDLYIMDMNNTPWGPPNHIGVWDGARAVRTIARTFERVFVK